MARIYDNLETKFTDGLQGIISNVGVKRVDFCVGYFNLRGWNLIVNEVDQLSGDFVYEQNDRIFRTCRLLIGMHRPDEDLVRSLYSGKKQLPDAEYVQKCRIAIARDFKKQLLLGLPSKKRRMDAPPTLRTNERRESMRQALSSRAPACQTLSRISARRQLQPHPGHHG